MSKKSVPVPTSNKIHYIIDEEKRTVVAYMDNCEFDVLNLIKKNGLVGMFEYYPTRCNINPDDYRLPFVFRGKAKCAPEDDWNVEYGKTLARNRMLEKYYDARYRLSMKFMAKVNERIMDFDDTIVYAIRKIDRAEDCKL